MQKYHLCIFDSYILRRGYHYERMTAFAELDDKDVLRVVLRNPQEIIQPQSCYYGIRSYNPLSPQSQLGMSKFFSMIKFLVS